MSSLLDLTTTVVALLQANPALAGGFIHVGRAFPLPQNQSQGVFVGLARAGGEMPFTGDGRTDWTVELVISMAARAPAGGNGLAAADALLQSVYGRLAAADSLWVLTPALAWDVDEADQTLGGAELRLRISHRTAAGSLAAAT